MVGETLEEFVRGIASAQQAVVRELGRDERLHLTAAELERLQHTDPYTCQLCGAPVYPLNGHWWNATDGDLHNRSCRPPEAAGQ